MLQDEEKLSSCMNIRDHVLWIIYVKMIWWLGESKAHMYLYMVDMVNGEYVSRGHHIMKN